MAKKPSKYSYPDGWPNELSRRFFDKLNDERHEYYQALYELDLPSNIQRQRMDDFDRYFESMKQTFKQAWQVRQNKREDRMIHRDEEWHDFSNRYFSF